MSITDNDSQACFVINKLRLPCLDKNHNKDIIVSKKIIITNQLVKNFLTLIEDERKKSKDWGLKKDYSGFIILTINKVDIFL